MRSPPTHPRRLVFCGTPEIAVPTLRALHAAGYELPLVVTRVDKRRHRRGGPEPSPVKAAAQELGLAVSSQMDDALGVGADLGVVVAYGRIIKAHVLDALPMMNLHFSLLPRWRGAAPVERAILAGDRVTGACVMALDEGLDTGPVYRCVEVPIGADETADDLRGRLVDAGTGLVLEVLAEGLGEPRPQEGEPTYAEKLEPEDLRLDWSRPSTDLARLVRVGGAWTTFREGRLKVHAAAAVDSSSGAPGEVVDDVVAAGDGGLRLVEVQAEGRRRQAMGEWSRGARVRSGERMGG